jgi:uncharacterized surface protein with fasciclin (FAS1) repeats
MFKLCFVPQSPESGREAGAPYSRELPDGQAGQPPPATGPRTGRASKKEGRHSITFVTADDFAAVMMQPIGSASVILAGVDPVYRRRNKYKGGTLMPKAISTKMMLAVSGALLAISVVPAGANPMVGGAAMYPTKDIIDNAVNSKDHTTLVAAVKAAGLVETLKGPGPFTVFAPTDAAFKKLPAGTVETLVKPENKATLTGILTYHVVPGRITAANIAALAKAHMGKAELTTVQGEKLTASKDAKGKWWLTDAKGGKAMITIADVMQSNGVIHVVDSVLMP